MTSVSAIVTRVFVFVMTTLLVFPAISLADDTDPTGAKLRELHETQEYKDALGQDPEKMNIEDFAKWELVCKAEALTLVGGIVWVARQNMDSCKYYASENTLQYCVEYSLNCDHYNWNADCMRKHVLACS